MEVTKKYELTDETIEHDGHMLRRIRASKDFGDVKAGELGGFIEDESNLSHEGKCWVYNNAKIFANAKVRENATIWDNSKIYGNAVIYGNALIGGATMVCDNAKVFGGARIKDIWVVKNTEIFGSALIFGWTRDSKNNVY